MPAIVRTSDGREYTLKAGYEEARDRYDELARGGYQRWDVTLSTGAVVTVPVPAVTAILNGP